jgi:fatty-acyl-CoA synthase
MFKMVMDHPSFPTADLSSLRTLMIGAAPVPVAMLETYQARGVATIQGYGLTEAGGFNLYLSAADSVRKVGSTGVEALYCQVKAVNDADQETAPGEVGELLVAGPCVTPGYWRNEEATAAAFLDGWLRTGDLVTRDEEGYYTVVDRKKDMVISGGLNVYPAEVESVLFGFEEIAEAAVVGLPDEKWGERVTAFIKLHPGRELTADEVIARCRRDLAAYKVPKQVEFVDEMPKTVSGKIQKRVLRDQYGRPNEPSGAGAGADA